MRRYAGRNKSVIGYPRRDEVIGRMDNVGITLADLAAEVGTSGSTLSRRFKSELSEDDYRLYMGAVDRIKPRIAQELRDSADRVMRA